MKVKFFVAVSLASLLSTEAMAESLWPILETTECSPFLTLSLGPAFTAGSETESFHLQPDVAKTYTSNHNPYAFGAGELFFGMQMPVMTNLLGQIGVAVVGGLNAPLHGNIWEDQDPDFNNYSYQYKVNHAHIAVKGKISTDTNTIVQPYVSGSIGTGVNHSRDFSISPLIYEEIPAPAFTTGKDSGLVYTVGIGIQTSYSEHWLAGVGYEFGDWGNFTLGRAPGQTVNPGLGSNHFFTHQLQFSLTYVFAEHATREK